MKILLIDDHAVVRKGVIDILSGMQTAFEFDEAETSAGAIELFSADPDQYDLVILDLHLPDENGLQTLEKIRRISEELPVLVLSMHDAAEYAVRAFQAGANGYVTKGSVPEELHTAIEKICDGKTFASEHLVGQLLNQVGCTPKVATPPKPDLSEREATVLRLLAKGEGVTAIGNRLGLSPKTVATYRARVLNKLGLMNNAELVRYAYENGIMLDTD